MKCKVCGGEVSEGIMICPICGMPVTGSESGSKPAMDSLDDIMSKNEKEESSAKYSMVGGNTAPSNPFGMDPSNQAAREAQEEARKRVEMEEYGAGAYGAGGYGAGGAGGYGAGGAGPYGQNPNGPGMYGQENRPLDLSAFDSRFDPLGGPVRSPQAVPKKNDTTLTVIITIAICLVLVFIALWKTGILDNHEMDGNYKFYGANVNGVVYSPEQLKEMGLEYDVNSFYLEIDGKKATVRLSDKGGTAKVSFKNNKVKIEDDSRMISGTYDKDEGTISLEARGIILIFKK